jgi:hypothetical protein
MHHISQSSYNLQASQRAKRFRRLGGTTPNESQVANPNFLLACIHLFSGSGLFTSKYQSHIASTYLLCHHSIFQRARLLGSTPARRR